MSTEKNVLFKSCCLIFISICQMLFITVSIHAQQAVPSALNPSKDQREKILFDNNWRFHRGGAQGADAIVFDDTNWRRIDLPHDWSIENIPGTNSPFDQNAISQVSGGFTIGGTGWYRKTFIIPSLQRNKKVWLQFDGVYMNADVWLNGQHLGMHPYGYTSFWYDITDKIKFGEKNVLAVQVKNEGENSRWYSGSGIYRHVWLILVNPIHIAHWGVAINTLDANEDSARINIKTIVKNETDSVAKITLVTHLLDTRGKEVKKIISEQNIATDSGYLFNQDATIQSPSLWSVDSPNIYTAVEVVYFGNQLLDSINSRFGIRTISYDAVNGFCLNGKRIKLKGGAVHQDNGPLGAKAYDRADIRRIELLKASGFNAVRCAHNPPSPAFLTACDSIGLMVIDEAFDMWKDGKNPFDYHLYFDKWWGKDIQSMIQRDRNHPSIIMWSIGNEIPDMDNPKVANEARKLADYVRSFDTEIPVTAAVNSVNEKKDPFFSALNICGYNYAKDQYGPDHLRHPNRIMFATESYPLDAYDYWMAVLDHPWVIGDFVWTAFDYIGEASIGWLGYPQSYDFYPWTLAYCGDINICGWKRPQSYYRDALWKKNQLSIFVKNPMPSFKKNPNRALWSKWNWQDVVADWNWEGYENKPLEVYIYSSCEQVELFLNGKSLGKEPTNRTTKYMAVWQVPFQAGTLKAIGYSEGKPVNISILKTAKAPALIKLSADRMQIHADNQDLSYVTVEITDANGVRNPKSENLINFQIKGSGTIVGVGNANPMSTESYQLPQRKAWHGRCLVIVKSTRNKGDIMLKASSPGLKSGSIVIQSVE